MPTNPSTNEPSPAGTSGWLARARNALSRFRSRRRPTPAAALLPYYERKAPSNQTIIGIFGDSWKSALPGERSGSEALFNDQRVAWLDARLPGGLSGKSVLELGPFEGYHSYQLDERGTRETVSVEGNSINFLKCLCIKEMYRLKTQFLFGDIQAYLDTCERRFDVVFASGVLYHSQDPVRFIDTATRLTDHFYLWTHCHTPGIAALNNGQEKHFVPSRNRLTLVDGRGITLYARSYLRRTYRATLPLYWEGGQEDVTYWLSREDLYWLIERAGFEVASDGGQDCQVNGLPFVSVYARRKPLPD